MSSPAPIGPLTSAERFVARQLLERLRGDEQLERDLRAADLTGLPAQLTAAAAPSAAPSSRT